MKKLLLLCWLVFANAIVAQQLHIESFGQPNAKPILFLHGGPGYNSANFEITTAQTLADAGYFVITYDRRGEGRSSDSNAKFNFEETFADIDAILALKHLQQVTLMGHSFGGIVATLYAKHHPDRVKSVVLVGAPMSLQESFTNIINRCRAIFASKNDTASLGYMDKLEAMDHSSLEYSSYCFMYAMQNGFYKTKNPVPAAKAIYDQLKTSPDYKWATQMTQQPTRGFYQNERYTTLDLSTDLRDLAKKVKVIGLYGVDDGLYSPAQIEKLKTLIGGTRVFYLDQCSHNVFIDRQDEFLKIIKAEI